MKNIYFDLSANRWGLKKDTSCYWGHERTILSPIPHSENLVAFKVLKMGSRLGPLVGLLTSDHPRKQFAGNRETFSRIDKEMKLQGGICFVFTPSGMKDKEINGYVLIKNKWTKAAFPYPDVIYNRIPSVKSEQSPRMKKAFKQIKQKGIPLFNPHFFNKWELTKLMRSDNILKTFLPDTTIVYPNTVQSFLNKYKSTYLKPIFGQKGKGIFTITMLDSDSLLVQDLESKKILPVPKLWQEIKLRIANKDYLIQQAIPLDQYKNRNYDMRVHVQKGGGSWDVTGIGVRCAAKGAITTHVPNGGEILPVDVLNPPISYDLIKDISKRIALILEQAYGKIIEFSIDIGRDNKGGLWIFEVNSKPMVFDEPSIQKKGLSTLIETFYVESHFI